MKVLDPEMTSLEKLIVKCKKGKSRAQRSLFDMTCDHLKSVAIRYVVDDSLAEDVLQEAYIRIYQGLKSFTYINDAAAIAWMRRITATEALRYLKKYKNWDQLISMEMNSPAPAIEQNHGLFHDELFQLLLKIPPNQRMVFNMYIIEGYSHKEISAQLGFAESTSRSLLTRARKYLQSKINHSNCLTNV